MVRSLILRPLEVVDRVMKKRVFAFNAAVGVVEARDAHRLLTRMLLVLATDHVDLAAHLNGVIQRVYRVSSMVLAPTLELALIDAIIVSSAWHV